MDKIISENRRSKLPYIIPVIALLATFWLVYKTISEAGVEVIVNFKDGSSLKEGKTFVKYKGFNVGKVTAIKVANDVRSINAHIKLNHNVGNILAREGTDYWIVEPKISVSEISGLDTIVSGSYIEVRSSKNSKDEIEKLNKQYFFSGYAKKPLKYYNENGVNLILQCNNSLDIKIGTPIYYKKIETGKVIGTKLQDNRIEVYINIYKEYENLVNASTIFYNSSGVELKAGLDGVDLKIDSIASLISGGISFETLDLNSSKVTENKRFKLYSSYEDTGIDKIDIEFNIKDSTSLKADKTAIVYKGLMIGKLIAINYDKDKISASARIDKKYSHLLSENTKFYKVNSDVTSLDFSNLDTIIKGSYISIVPHIGKSSHKFDLYESYNDLNLEDMLMIKLKSNKFANLNIGSDVYYKNIVIGRVINHEFEDNYKYVNIDVAIDKKYKKILNDKTLFYIISTPLIESENLDFRVNFERVKPFVLGGIGLEYFPSSNKKVQKRFWLYDSYIELQKEKKSYVDGYRVKVKLKENMSVKDDVPILYNGFKIGYVQSSSLTGKTPYATLFIENKYKNLIQENSKFYKQSAIEFDASVSGVNLKMSSFNELLKGSIILTNKIKNTPNTDEEFKYVLYDDFEDLPFLRKEFVLNSGDSKGIKKGTKVIYKGVEVGKIYSKKLNNTLDGVILNGYFYKEYEKLASKDSIFYIVKPEISLKGVKGLDSILGQYIEVIKGKSDIYSSKFTLNNRFPKVSEIRVGKSFQLFSTKALDLTTASKIYYKKREIGVIDSIDLGEDSSKTAIKIFIFDKYKNLVRENSKFYIVSGIDVDISLLGANIKAQTLETVLNGGIALITPNEVGDIAKEDSQFRLFDDIDEKWKEFNPKINLR